MATQDDNPAVSNALLLKLSSAQQAVAELHGALHAADDWGHGHLCSQIEKALALAIELHGATKLSLEIFEWQRRSGLDDSYGTVCHVKNLRELLSR